MCVCFRESDDDDDDDGDLPAIDGFSLLASRKHDFRTIREQMSCASLVFNVLRSVGCSVKQFVLE